MFSSRKLKVFTTDILQTTTKMAITKNTFLLGALHLTGLLSRTVSGDSDTGRCGPSGGELSCLSSGTDNGCCSPSGWCGDSSDHCGAGCLSEFGVGAPVFLINRKQLTSSLELHAPSRRHPHRHSSQARERPLWQQYLLLLKSRDYRPVYTLPTFVTSYILI